MLHRRENHPDELAGCRACGYTLINENALLAHIKKNHLNDDNVFCLGQWMTMLPIWTSSDKLAGHVKRLGAIDARVSRRCCSGRISRRCCKRRWAKMMVVATFESLSLFG